MFLLFVHVLLGRSSLWCKDMLMWETDFYYNFGWKTLSYCVCIRFVSKLSVSSLLFLWFWSFWNVKVFEWKVCVWKCFYVDISLKESHIERKCRNYANKVPTLSNVLSTGRSIEHWHHILSVDHHNHMK